MKKLLILFFCGSAILFMIIASGCIAPPKEIPAATSNHSIGGAGPSVTPTVTGTPSYLSNATPFPTTAAPYAVITETPALNQEAVCLIGLTQFDAPIYSFSTAKSFNLKNPPMYINFSVTNTFNETGTRTIDESHYGLGYQTVSYSYYNPVSYLEITVRNKTTGHIYSDDGFGLNYGYYLNKSYSILNRDDMLIEIKGYNLSAVVGVWVKPYGNDVNATGFECKKYSDFGPNSLYPGSGSGSGSSTGSSSGSGGNSY